MVTGEGGAERVYDILGVVGKGGFGTVYKAVRRGAEGFSRTVALKMLHADLETDAESMARLRDEARMLAQLDVRGVVRVDDVVRLGGRVAMVMEFVDGVDLDALMAQGALPARASAELVAEAAAVLDAVYTCSGEDGEPLRAVHRDIKPGNVMVTSQGEVKVLDFGIARAELRGREAKTTSRHFWTPGYGSPERSWGESGPACDVYALGVVLFEAATGERLVPPPVERERHDATMALNLQRLDGPLHRLRPLVARALSWDPQARPSASEVAAELRALAPALEGVSLATWVQGPQFQQARGRGLGQDELAGRALSEGHSGFHRRVATAPPLPDWGRWLLVGSVSAAVLFGAILVVAVGVVAVRYVDAARDEAADETPDAVPRVPAVTVFDDPPPGAPAASPAPTPEAPPAASPEAPNATAAAATKPDARPSVGRPPPAAAATPTAVTAAAATPAAATPGAALPPTEPAAPPADEAPLPLAAPATGTVQVLGDIPGVRIQDAAGDLSVPGAPLEPGTYRLVLPEPDGKRQHLGWVQVAADTTARVTCRAAFRACGT